ncbi:hypothetical protein QUB68_09005 [Microcoleus sp. A006_D1]|uniref:hypothetical protein n=1 Tax=Microcoleus sp. A006_D1 TaxID=3055267 RepID=UPI002FCF76BB
MSRNVLPLREPLDEINAGVSDPVGKRHWKTLLKPVAAAYVQRHSSDVFVIEEAILDCVGDKQITCNAQDKNPFTAFG